MQPQERHADTMIPSIPKFARGIVVKKTTAPQIAGYKNDAVLTEYAIPPLKQGEVLVKINAVAFNHKDVWTRKGLYPRITQGSFYGGDGAGLVVASGSPGDELLNQRVFLSPSRGWWDDPVGPENQIVYSLGGAPVAPGGTFAEYIVVERQHVIRTPLHLDDVHAAAWPLGGITAWRVAMVNANVQPGHNVLITGIGGGVALLAMQLCVAAGANVYVTSGHKRKLLDAMKLGAKGGAIYKDADWPAQIRAQLKNGAYLDSVIDSGGGDILGKVSKSLRSGGRVVVYGMQGDPTVTLTMREVLLNQQVIGSTGGSHRDLEDATRFIAKHNIVPIVSHVLDGLESAEEGFRLIERGDQFGKVVIKLRERPLTVQARL